MAAREGIKGGAKKRWRTRRRAYSQTGPALDRRPIESDPAFKTYIAKLNNPEKPLARANYLDCVGAAYAMLKSMGIPITDHSMADLVKRKEENPRDMSIEKALMVLKSTPTVRTNTVHASRMVGLFKANFVPVSIHIWVKSGPNESCGPNCGILVLVRNNHYSTSQGPRGSRCRYGCFTGNLQCLRLHCACECLL